ncbi:EAL domain-containing protein [Sphingobium sufflavum]|uniref:putative bifunctional diguanylate cyclase/phosphodiesterase n=1 Tax=Sphingobium sufflavum TaxID=1129547 RepID=UPI001F1EC526|nr:EAL domain-containing protein [Sphingobium sufflavum]MCE7796562.1 EAL domain-containing protein [Sphingobium sufflavum]
MGRRLSVRMTIFYAALFVAVTGLSLFGTQLAIERYAERSVHREMLAGAAVFNRIADMHFDQLGQASQVLAADFGFRTAAATGDAPTIASALDSLKGRLGLDDAVLVTINGTIIGDGSAISVREQEAIYSALDEGSTHGIAHWGKANHMVVASPIRAPVLIGWVVFAKDLRPGDLRQLASLSAVDLKPVVLPASSLPMGLRQGNNPTVELERHGQRFLVQAIAIRNFGSHARQTLLLEFNLSEAMAAYSPILWSLLAFGVTGVVLAILGSWVLAKRLSDPLIALDAAVRQVGTGERVSLAIRSSDEIGRLARSFNRMVEDIAAREEKILHMGLHDELTGLPNRALLEERIRYVLQRGAADAQFCILYLDLDNFKSVNETLGHLAGDALLCEAAQRLRQHSPDIFIARLSGDEFVLLLEDGQSPDVTADIALRAMAQPFFIGENRIDLGASGGIAVVGPDGADAITLLKNAELALHRAKQESRGTVRYFKAKMDADAQKRRALAADLREALQRNELELHFQPLFNLKQDRITAFEALMRWRHPERGYVSPVEFIPIAEDTGLMIPFGEWALQEACRTAAQWPDHVRVAVNISPVQFRSDALAQIVLRSLAASGLAPHRLELEITESLFIDDVETTLGSLNALRQLGVRVALDDFGTGYSSLAYLRSFPFDKVKIDRSFIVDLMKDKGSTAIIKAITALADALGMETTAEGVEHGEEVEILRAQGCTHIQGYYYSRPVPALDAGKLLEVRSDSQAA